MTTPVPLADAFGLESVLFDLPSGPKEVVLEALVSHAVAGKTLPRGRKGQVVDALLERENRGSTAFGRGVAVPHARIAGLRRPVGVVARSVEGVDFRATDGEPVHVFIMLVSPENRAEEHLATLKWISRMARSQDFVSFVLQARTPADVLDVLQEHAP